MLLFTTTSKFLYACVVLFTTGCCNFLFVLKTAALVTAPLVSAPLGTALAGALGTELATTFVPASFVATVFVLGPDPLGPAPLGPATFVLDSSELIPPIVNVVDSLLAAVLLGLFPFPLLPALAALLVATKFVAALMLGSPFVVDSPKLIPFNFNVGGPFLTALRVV